MGDATWLPFQWEVKVYQNDDRFGRCQPEMGSPDGGEGRQVAMACLFSLRSPLCLFLLQPSCQGEKRAVISGAGWQFPGKTGITGVCCLFAAIEGRFPFCSGVNTSRKFS